MAPSPPPSTTPMPCVAYEKISIVCFLNGPCSLGLYWQRGLETMRFHYH